MNITRKLFLIWLAVICFLVPAAYAQQDYSAYLSPWETDVAAESRKAGELRFYFMSGEGLRMTNTTESFEKWGDSCLVVFPTGELMLIDAAMPDYTPVLVQNLERMGVKKIDYLLISHPHGDHAGGIYAPDGIPEHFEIGKAFYNGTYNGDWNDPHMLEKIWDEHGIPREVITEGWTMDIGEVHMQVISPSPDVIGQFYYNATDVNNASIVLRMDFRDFSALFTGDIYRAQENVLIKTKADLLDVDLLKLAHHGHNTSNSKSFAQAVTPKLAVATGSVAVQGYEYFNFTKLGAKVRFDYLDGYIRVRTDGEYLEWDQSRERETDFYDVYEYENLKNK